MVIEACHLWGHRETVPSGALTLDIALGGGFPKGRIIEVCPSSTATLCIIMQPHMSPSHAVISHVRCCPVGSPVSHMSSHVNMLMHGLIGYDSHATGVWA